ncbi:MAG: hypothetical protein ACKVW3_14105 [Phycisphaerales bacterium]
MITLKTTFIIGAGCSIPFGFPSADELHWKIIDLLENAQRRHELAEAVEREESFVNEFRFALQHANCFSIDRFIEGCPEFLNIGKAAIASVLLPREIELQLVSRESAPEHWLRYIWDKMQTGKLVDVAKNQVSFVVFNYDRSIEHYLVRAMSAIYRDSNLNCARVLSTVPIIHIYGSLGRYPGLAGALESDLEVSYSGDCSAEQVRRAMKCITLAPESQAPQAQSFADARTAIARSNRVVFLGFGYGRANVERLGNTEFWQDVRSRTPIWGTVLGMEEAELRAVHDAFGIQLQHYGPSVRALQFLRKHFDRW